jgi:Tfp pilus assembly protein PilV
MANSSDNQQKSASMAGFIWSKTAFMVEALILLVVLIASMAVFTQLFARSWTRANESDRLTNAVVVAQNAAEEFCSDPVAVKNGQTVGQGIAKNGSGNFKVECKVTETSKEAGTLYTANISVSDGEGVVYQVTSSQYVSGAN